MKGNSSVRLTWLAVCWLALPGTAVLLFAHGVDVPKPTAADLARVQPPLPGAEHFARVLLETYRNKLDAEQMRTLDELGGSLRLAEQIRAGQAQGLDPKDAEYYRWRADAHLLRLIEQLPDVVALDFQPGRPAHNPDSPVEVDQQFNLVLLKVVTGDGAVRFVVHDMDLTGERDPQACTIPIGARGTTYVLLRLEHTRTDQAVTHLVFQSDRAGSPGYRHALKFVFRPSGQLALAVLDENGRPTPVLLRLTARASQRLIEPAGACDLREMMNAVTGLPIYGPGRGYMVYIPGPFQGRYWVVPKAFEMPLPAGEYEIHVLHGLEYEPVRERLRIEPGGWTRKTVRLRRWVHMPRRGWYSGDDHVHSRLMSSEDADRLMAFTRAADIHVSNVLEMGNEMRTWYAQRGFGPEFRVRDGLHWLVPGQEDPRSQLGHAIGLNLRAKVRDLDRYYLNDWIAEEIHRQGGLYGHTHVGNSEVKTLFTERQMALFTPMNIVDFNSILQTKLGLDLFYDFLNLGFKMTASAGSDTPYGGTVGCVRLYAWCGRREFTPDRWFEALRRGHTFVTTGPMLEFTVDNALPGDEVRLKPGRPVRVKARAWGRPGASAPAKLRLVQFGRVLREVEASSAEETELRLEAKVDGGFGCWLAAHATGQDGSEAHSTPVYVLRDGFRFWDVTQAAMLIQKQLAVLDEIETAVAEAVRVMSTARQPLDYWNRWPAEQAVQIRRRIETTRQVYTGLLATLDSERAARTPRPHPGAAGEALAPPKR